MRFTADGIDLPDELLWAQDEGRVVFFCGAGVSRANANLPDFDGLTEQVLNGLGATQSEEARRLYDFCKVAKSEHGVGIAMSDQVFQLLRRSFTDADISKKVAECLKPEESVDLSAHRTLLKLATLKTGETRLVTTNFDRLFEQCNSRLATSTRSTLPHLAFNEADWGIVHLHGCVNADYSGPAKDGFILSSAEFGEAYLARGWARDFVREILQRYVAVFIGYAANDPPIRYLLEGLQQSKAQNNLAYAFQPIDGDASGSSWDEKGVQALTYQAEKGCGHRRLWETLSVWATRHADPEKWRARRLSASSKSPAKLAPHERGMIAHIVNSASGALSFAEHRPLMSAEWLCVFDPQIRFGEPRSENGRYDGAIVDPHDRYRLDSDPPPRVKNKEFGLHERRPDKVWSAFSLNAADLKDLRPNQVSSVSGHFARTIPYLPRRQGALASWIGSVSDQPAAVWWAAQQDCLHHEILDRVRLNVDREKDRKKQPVTEAWKAIFECHELSDDDDEPAYRLRLDAEDLSSREHLARKYANHFSPTLKLSNQWCRPVPPIAGPQLTVSDLVSVNVEYSEGVRTVAVPDDFIPPLMPKLRAALELAQDLESRYSYSIDFCSIEPDETDKGEDDGGQPDFSRQYKLSGQVLLFVKLFKRFVALDVDAARAELDAWPRQGEVFQRLRVWAIGNLDVASPEAFAAELFSLSEAAFWPFRGDRDLLLGLARRWGAFDSVARKALEKRLLKGPPKYKRVKEPDYAERSAHRRLSRINWLASRGCEFSFNLDSLNTRLGAQAPNWKPEYAKSAAESHDGKGGWVRTDTDYSAVADLPASVVIEFIEGVERRPIGHFVSYEPFLGLSKQRPEKALSALAACNARDPFPARFWETFLGVEERKNDAPNLLAAIVHELRQIPDGKFSQITYGVSNWFERIGPGLLTLDSVAFETLWEKIIGAMRAEDFACRSSELRQDQVPDWATEAINSSAGKLAELAVSIPVNPPPQKDEGFPEDWLARIGQLLNLPGDSRRLALVILGHQLNRLFYVDPVWSQTHILSALDGVVADADQDAIWAGFLWNAQTPSRDLFMRLKPQLLQLGRRQFEQRARRYVEILAGMALAGWGSTHENSKEKLISSAEMRALLLEASDELREHIVTHLIRWSADEDGRWATQIAEFLRDTWPKQKSVRTARISARLCELALSQKANFAEIAILVSRLVTKVGDDRLIIPSIRGIEETIAGQHPEETLELLHAVLPDNFAHWPYGADSALRALGELRPALRGDARYISLEGKLR